MSKKRKRYSSGFKAKVALEEAIGRYGTPEIFNTDQGTQFTGRKFTGVLKSNNIQISMDGRNRVYDNIFIERLWWTVKYHYVYLHEFENGLVLKKGHPDLFLIANSLIANSAY